MSPGASRKPPWYRTPGWVVFLSTVAILAVTVPYLLLQERPAGRGVDSSTVEITSCTRGERTTSIGWRVVNNSARSRTFRLRFEVVSSSGDRVGLGSERVPDLAPGQAASGEVVVFGVGSRCLILDWS